MQYFRDNNPGPGWQDRVVTLWMEDDAPVPDKETTGAALCRFMGTPHPGAFMEEIDGGDTFTRLYPGGWVETIYPEGGEIGVVFKKSSI